MAYLNEEEVVLANEASQEEANQWRENYPEYERLADNGLLDDLDEDLPEVNDGSLAASLFKLAKRVIKKKMTGRAIALDRDDDWITELANIYWEKKILPNAKTKASPRRKWKDAARKAAIYGGQPIVTLFGTRGSYRGSDFMAPYAPDVRLEAGKDSDEDSDILFWDVYYSELQMRNMLEDARSEMADYREELAAWKERQSLYEQELAENEQLRAADPEIDALPPFDEDKPAPYNKYNIAAINDLLKQKPSESRTGINKSRTEEQAGVQKTGYKLTIAFQRGVDAPFTLFNPNKSAKTKNWALRTWSNPDPTGDVPIHYLYMYQDFINPYGIGIVKLAGGTQNVLDYMRKIDILATQIGVRPPKLIHGDEEDVDEDSMVYSSDANWYVGSTQVEPWNMANGIYNQLPQRISMYQTSLQKLIPIGDSTISSTDSGDAAVGKTPQALQMAAQSLSIDDEDFSENIDECYAAVAASMINTQFANMQGTDLLKLNEDERERLTKAGLPFTVDEETQEAPLELDVVWDNCRANFQFEMDPDRDKTDDEQAALEGKLKAYEMLQADPTIDQQLAMSGKKLNRGELLSDIFGSLTDNDKIITDISPQEQAQTSATAGMMPGQPQIDPTTGQPIAAAPVAGQPGQLPAQPGQAAPMPTQAPQAAQPAPAPQMGLPAPDGAPQSPGQGSDLTPEEQQAGDKIAEVQELFNVDPHVAAMMLEAEDQGFDIGEIIASAERNGLVAPGTAEHMAASQPQLQGEQAQ